MFDFSIVTSWVHELLTSFMPLGLAIFIECVIVGLCILLMYVVVAILMIFMERKVCAAFQCRLGPMRVGPWGTLQVFADVFKMLTKEIITIRHADKIIVLDDGEIAGMGTHDELLKDCTVYQEIYYSQYPEQRGGVR